MLPTIYHNLREIARLSEQLLTTDLDAELRKDFVHVHKAAGERMPHVLKIIETELSDKTFVQAVAQVSSEWRAPINTISGYCQLAQEGIYGPLTAEQLRLIQDIQALAEELGVLSAPSKDDPEN